MSRNAVRGAQGLSSRSPIAGALSLALAGVGFASFPSHAQEGRVIALEEVVVTAQKREELAQDVPIAMTVMDAEELSDIGVFSLSDLKTTVPSLQLRPFPTAAQSLTPYIRGIGNGFVDVFQDPSVATHINGVYLARPNGINFDLVDVERIEVLRGPQGSLYGRNSTGGAINIVTAKPTDQFAFSQQFTVGNYDFFNSRSSVNLPISDNLAAKLSYAYAEKEGFVSNSRADNNFGDRENDSVRFDVRWTPTPDLTVDYSFDWSQIEYLAGPFQSLDAKPGGTGADIVSHNPNFLDTLDPGFDVPDSRVKNWGNTLSIDWEMGDISLRSITAHREVYDRYLSPLASNGNGFRLDTGATDLFGAMNIPDSYTGTDQKQFSQEFQFLGDVGDNLRYVVGLYYFQEEGVASQPFGHQITIPNGAAPGIDVISLFGRDAEGENTSTAIFGEFAWSPAALRGDMEVVLGARYSRDKREAVLSQQTATWLSIAPFPPFNSFAPTQVGATGFASEADETFNEFTPSLTVRYHWDSNLMTYAKVAEGYKSGGYNTRAPDAAAFELGFKPETLTSYELGLKADWLGSRIRTNAALFYYDYEDMQLTVGIPERSSIFSILNAGESRFSGFEMDAIALLTADLKFTAHYTYIDTDLKEVVDGDGNIVTEAYNIPFVSRDAYSAGLDYTIPGVALGEVSMSARYDYIGEMSNAGFTNQANAGAYVDSYGLWNARLRWTDIALQRGSLELAVWGRNLSDKHYVLAATGEVPYSQRAAIWGEPRSYGVDVIYRFN